MKTLSPRELRRVWACAAELFKPKSLFVPQNFEEWKAVTDGFSRELQLTNHRKVLLTDASLALLRRTVALLNEFDLSAGLAAYSDISTACRHVLQDCLSNGIIPQRSGIPQAPRGPPRFQDRNPRLHHAALWSRTRRNR